MKKEEAAAIAKKLTAPSIDAIKFLATARPEADMKNAFSRWGHIRNALNRRELIKATKAGVFSLNGNGRAVLKALA